MRVNIERTPPPLSSDIDVLESHFGRLPKPYFEFISAHDGAYCSAILEIENLDEIGLNFAPGVERFIKVSEILKNMGDIEGLPSTYFPIANDGAGGLTCLKRPDFAVYLFDHNFAELYCIAPDFQSWLEKLVPFD